MLVLSRKRSEQIVIDGPCVVTLVEIRGDKVRLGFTAEEDTTIMRSELLPETTVPDGNVEAENNK